MTFLAVSPLAAYALLGGVALAILLLHLLKPRPGRAIVGSGLLWASVLKRHSSRAPHWRRYLAVLLALGIGLSLALAMTRPQMSSFAAKRTVLVLDNSPSMAARTRDGSTRWLHAQARARHVLETTSGEVMLLDTMGAAPVSGYVGTGQAMAVLERLTVGAQGMMRMPPLQHDRNVEVHLFTDGVALSALPAEAVVHSVFEAADNVAITGLQTRPFPTDPSRWEAFVQVYNASPGAKRVRLTLRGAGQFSIKQDLEIAAGELVDASFDVSAFEGGILAAGAAAPDDAYPLDDIAFARVAAHRPRKVLLVTDGNPRLEDSLRALPGIRLEVVSPAAHQRGALADAYVFDRFAPAAPPPAGALLFRPPVVPWLPAPSREVANPQITGWDPAHPLTAGQSWQELRVKRARLVDDEAAEAVVTTREGPLVLARHDPSPWILVGFSSQESNLPLQPGFPIFLGTALDWLTAAAPALLRPLGSIEVPLLHAQVHDGRGAPVAALDTANGVVFDAARPDVYTVVAGSRRTEVIANVLDPRHAEINRSPLREQRAPPPATVRRWSIEPAALLLVVSALLLLVEWTTYTRRITA